MNPFGFDFAGANPSPPIVRPIPVGPNVFNGMPINPALMNGITPQMLMEFVQKCVAMGCNPFLSMPFMPISPIALNSLSPSTASSSGGSSPVVQGNKKESESQKSCSNRVQLSNQQVKKAMTMREIEDEMKEIKLKLIRFQNELIAIGINYKGTLRMIYQTAEDIEKIARKAENFDYLVTPQLKKLHLYHHNLMSKKDRDLAEKKIPKQDIARCVARWEELILLRKAIQQTGAAGPVVKQATSAEQTAESVKKVPRRRRRSPRRIPSERPTKRRDMRMKQPAEVSSGFAVPLPPFVFPISQLNPAAMAPMLQNYVAPTTYPDMPTLTYMGGHSFSG